MNMFQYQNDKIPICEFLGPFVQTSHGVNSVDYSYQIANNYYSIVFPLKLGSKKWFFIEPFSFRVWLCFMICLPIYLLAMGMADYLFNGYADLGELSSFIVRNALSEQNYALPNKQEYKRLLIVIWAWSMLVLVQSYAGNLTAMLARPKLQKPISTLQELVNQNDVSWIIPDEMAAYALKTSESGSVLRRLYDYGTIIYDKSYDCFPSETYREGMGGSICDIGSIDALLIDDYSTTGQCNYFTIEDKLLTSSASMALQVDIEIALEV